MKLKKFDIFLMRMCLLTHFVLKNVYANMFLSFIRFELVCFEHGNPISHKM